MCIVCIEKGPGGLPFADEARPVESSDALLSCHPLHTDRGTYELIRLKRLVRQCAIDVERR